MLRAMLQRDKAATLEDFPEMAATAEPAKPSIIRAALICTPSRLMPSVAATFCMDFPVSKRRRDGGEVVPFFGVRFPVGNHFPQCNKPS
jgi:hypothetical protein